MKESFNAAFREDLTIPTDSGSVILYMDSFFAPGTPPFNSLIQALKQEEKEKFGLPEIENLRFEVKRFDPITLKGRLRVLYNLQLTFSCSALVNDLNDQHSYWNFEIDPSTKTIRFEGDEYGDLRSTANEF